MSPNCQIRRESIMKNRNMFLRLSRRNLLLMGLFSFFFSFFSMLPVASGMIMRWYDGTAHTLDGANSIVVDSIGNFYVTGKSMGIGGNFDIATVKYDPNGKQKWVARYNGLKNSDDDSRSIAVDSNGNVYVTGLSFGSSTVYPDWVTIKYDSNGSRKWVRSYKSTAAALMGAYGVKIAVDTSGNVYVTGTAGLARGSFFVGPILTIKYDKDGNRIWVRGFGVQELTCGYPFDLAIDKSGNAYVAGTSDGFFVVIKYDTNGNLKWSSSYIRGFASSLAVDGQGNVYATGGYATAAGEDLWNCLTIKYDTNGNEKWAMQYSDSNGDSGRGITLDKSGNCYITGVSRSSVGLNYVILKYDTNGNQGWVRKVKGDLSGEPKTAIVSDSSGNVYVTCNEPNISGTGYSTRKFNSNGERQWVRRYLNGGSYVTDIAVDIAANVYVTGSALRSTSQYCDYLTIRYDKNGN